MRLNANTAARALCNLMLTTSTSPSDVEMAGAGCLQPLKRVAPRLGESRLPLEGCGVAFWLDARAESGR